MTWRRPSLPRRPTARRFCHGSPRRARARRVLAAAPFAAPAREVAPAPRCSSPSRRPRTRRLAVRLVGARASPLKWPCRRMDTRRVRGPDPIPYQLWLRPVATLAAGRFPVRGGAFPFWSPDSRFIGFFADGKLKKVAIAGGPPILFATPHRSWRNLESRQRHRVLRHSRWHGASGLMRVSGGGGGRRLRRPSTLPRARRTTVGRTSCPMAVTSSLPRRPGRAARRRSRPRSRSARSIPAKPPSRSFKPSRRRSTPLAMCCSPATRP